MKKLLSLITAAVLCLTVFGALTGCDNGGGGGKPSASVSDDSSSGGEVQKPSISGEYELLSAVSKGKNVTSSFSVYKVTFREDHTMSVYINYDGINKVRNSAYEFDGTTITETNGINQDKYVYVVDFDGTIVTNFKDYEDNIEIVLTKKEQAQVINEVDFESVLFGEGLNDTKKFNYCPAIITEKNDDGREVMHIWYCTNKDSGVIMDHVGYRVGEKQTNGKWKFSDERIVLEPTSGTWDARHTCDPAVIKGEFGYHGETYNYLMSYLGCTTEDYQKNETGFAVAKDIGGPWVKIDEINPIVPWYDDGDYATEEAKYQSYKGTTSIYWGTGMPALLSVDGKSEVILFYQSTLRGVGIRRMDLSDIANPVVRYTRSIASTGILNSANGSCHIGISDYAYDPVKGRLYVTSVTNERNPADVTLTRVNSHSLVAYIDGLNDMEAVSSALENGGYRWTMVGHVGPDKTGWERNHNPGLVRDSYGRIPDTSKVSVVVSTGHNSWANENIFTYRLFGWTFTV